MEVLLAASIAAVRLLGFRIPGCGDISPKTRTTAFSQDGLDAALDNATLRWILRRSFGVMDELTSPGELGLFSLRD